MQKLITGLGLASALGFGFGFREMASEEGWCEIASVEQAGAVRGERAVRAVRGV